MAKMATLSVEGRPKARSGKKSLPAAPEVDERKLAQAEREIEEARSPELQHAPSRAVKAPTMAERGPRRVIKDAENSKAGRRRMLLEGPAPVLDAFHKHMEDEGFKTKWDTLFDLLLKAGIDVEPFDY